MIDSIIMLIGFVVTFGASIFFSGAEIAIGNTSRDSLERLAKNKVSGAALVLGILKNKRRFQFMLVSGRIISIVGGTLLLSGILIQLFDRYGRSAGEIGFAAFIVAIIIFVTAESLLARIAALGEYEKIISRFAYFLAFSHIVLFPLTYILEKISSLFIKRNIELAAKQEALIELVKSESEDGVIEQEEKDMIESILEFSDTIVREVMVPRIDIVAAKQETTISELILLFKEEGHSRIPIYEDRIDNIVGVVYAKDLLTAIADKVKESFGIKDIMRSAFFVPETKHISDLLKEFRKTKVHIAIVIDEYGGTVGIVALEDLLEEIVGEIQDEFDDEKQDSLWINENTVIIDAGFYIDDVNEMINAVIPDEGFDTLGGFLYHQLGFIPKGGEKVEWKNFTFTIKEINGNRISKVLVKINESPTSDGKSGV